MEWTLKKKKEIGVPKPKKTLKSLDTPKMEDLKTFKWNEIENKKAKMGSLPLI
jgi:hypothetical protein